MQCRKAEIASAGPSGITGSLRIRAERRGERTMLSDVYRTAPFHLGQLTDRDAMGAEVIVQGVGPGYLPGDSVAIDISTGPEASLTVREQAALKLFPSPNNDAARSSIRLRCENEGLLIFLPGEIIPYRQAIFEQRVAIDVASNARVAYAEIITPGRTAMGEHFAFGRLDLRIDAAIDGEPILRERSLIEPAKRRLDLTGRNGGFNCIGVLYLIGPEWSSFGSGASSSGARWSSDAGESYVLVRYAAQTAQEIHAMIAEHLTLARTSPSPSRFSETPPQTHAS